VRLFRSDRPCLACQGKDSRNSALLATIRTLSQQNERLTNAIVDLKREGFTAPPQQVLQMPEESRPQAVAAAITLRAGKNRGLAIELWEHAQAQITAGADPEDVARVILEGSANDLDWDD
jgi:hypothetical protein